MPALRVNNQTDTYSATMGPTSTTIRLLREKREWSQEYLAEVAGVHDRTIGKIERGQMNFSVLMLSSLCKALDCSPNRLLDV